MINKIKLSISIVSLLFSSNLFAQFSQEVKGDATWITSDEVLLKEAMQLTDVAPFDMKVYSWAQRDFFKSPKKSNLPDSLPQSGPVDPFSEQTLQATWKNAQSRMSLFWSTANFVSGRSASVEPGMEKAGAMAPNGIYTATEPVVSRKYGGAGDTFVLYEFTIPKGTRYLKAVSRNKPAVGANLRKALLDRGCESPIPIEAKDGKDNSVLSARHLIKADTHQTQCRQNLIDIMVATGAKAIRYLFIDEPIEVCRKVDKWQTAFVIVHPDAVSNFQPYFSEHTQDNIQTIQSKQIINAAFDNVDAAYSKQFEVYKLPFKNAGVATYENLSNYATKYYLSCGSKSRN